MKNYTVIPTDSSRVFVSYDRFQRPKLLLAATFFVVPRSRVVISGFGSCIFPLLFQVSGLPKLWFTVGSHDLFIFYVPGAQTFTISIGFSSVFSGPMYTAYCLEILLSH